MQSFSNGFARNVVTFWFNYASSSHFDNQENNFLVSSEGPVEGINGSVGIADKELILT